MLKRLLNWDLGGIYPTQTEEILDKESKVVQLQRKGSGMQIFRVSNSVFFERDAGLRCQGFVLYKMGNLEKFSGEQGCLQESQANPVLMGLSEGVTREITQKDGALIIRVPLQFQLLREAEAGRPHGPRSSRPTWAVY